MNTRPPCAFLKTRRRLLASLCLAICGGFLIGIFHERGIARQMPLTSSEGNPMKTLPKGQLLGDAREGTNAFTATAARAMESGDYEQAFGHYRAALTEAKTAEERLALAAKLQELGVSAHMQGKGQGRIAIAAFEEALTVYRQAKPPQVESVARTLASLADAVALKGEWERAGVAWNEAVQLTAKSTDTGLTAEMLQRAGDFYRGCGKYETAREYLNRALAQQRRSRNQSGIAHSLRYLGMVASDQGEYPSAKASLEEAQRMLAATGETETRAAVLGELGDVFLGEGNLNAAIPLYREGLLVWESRKQTYWRAVFLARLGNAAYWQGDNVRAKRFAQESLSLLETSNGPVSRVLPLQVLGNVARREGKVAYAIARHTECLTLRRERGNPRGIAEGLEALALDRLAQKDTAGDAMAKRLFAEAARLRAEAHTPLSPLERSALPTL